MAPIEFLKTLMMIHCVGTWHSAVGLSSVVKRARCVVEILSPFFFWCVVCGAVPIVGGVWQTAHPRTKGRRKEQAALWSYTAAAAAAALHQRHDVAVTCTAYCGFSVCE